MWKSRHELVPPTNSPSVLRREGQRCRERRTLGVVCSVGFKKRRHCPSNLKSDLGECDGLFRETSKVRVIVSLHLIWRWQRCRQRVTPAWIRSLTVNHGTPDGMRHTCDSRRLSPRHPARPRRTPLRRLHLRGCLGPRPAAWLRKAQRNGHQCLRRVLCGRCGKPFPGRCEKI